MNELRVTILIYVIVLVVFTMTTTIVYLKSRKSKMLYSLILCQVLVILWLIFGINEILSRTQEELMFNVKLSLIPIFMLPSFWLIFSLLYCEYITLRNRWIIILIILPSIILYSPLLTSKYFYLVIIYKDISDPSKTTWGLFFWIKYIFMIICVLSSFIVMITKSIKEPKIIKSKYMIIVGTTLIPFVINLLDIFGLIISPKFFNITPVSFSVFFIIMSVYLNYYDFFEIMPFGFEFFESTKEATIVIDDRNKIIKWNHKTDNIFSNISKNIDCEAFLRNIGFLKSDKELQFFVKLKDTKEYVKYQGFKYNKLHYDIFVAPIFNKSNYLVMKIITFYDITEVYNLQKENYKKTKLLENIRIKGDMHDKIGNKIVLIKTLLETFIKQNYPEYMSNLAFRSHAKETNKCQKIRVVYELSEEALKLLREVCKNIEQNTYSVEDKNIINELKEIFEDHKLSGVIKNIHFKYEGNLILNSFYSEQIKMICTEALTNSIKHGAAENIYVILKNSENNINLIIIDDGKGCPVKKKLKSIENRVSYINGSVEYHSNVDSGFCIKIEFNCINNSLEEVSV